MPDVSSGTVAPPSRRVAGPDAAHGSLPRPLTSFIGRERELAQARRLLQDSYLVTLTGPGGSGKTRLCIALAAQVAAEYPDGVYFVPLAPVRDPGLVPSTIAQSIGLHDARDRPLMEHLVSQLPVIFFPMRGHRWRLSLPFAGNRGGQAPTLEEIQLLTDQRAPERVTVSDPTWLANFRCHRRSASAYRRGRVLLAGDAVHIHTPAGGQGMNTGITDAHNLGWKLALVASGRAPDSLLDSYGSERRPVADEVLKLTHTLVHYSSVSHPLKRRARDILVPALSRSSMIQRRAAGRLSHISLAYPPGPLARPDRGPGAPRAGQRMPDIQVHAGGQAATLHSILRDGRHVLVVPAAEAADILCDPGLRPYWRDLAVVTRDSRQPPRFRNDGTGPVVLVRPDGFVAARGRPDRLHQVTGYLRDLFQQPGCDLSGEQPADGAPRALSDTAANQ
jgi:hypothetical protein